MKIHETLRTHEPSFSFEFFPPKDDAGFEQLYQTIQVLKPLNPTYVSVTYGAGGSTRSKTVQLVERIKNELGIESMAHLTCVGATRDELGAVLEDLRTAGVDNVLALRGDPPRGETKFVAQEGGFSYANELIEFIRARHDFGIGAACYPEGHPEAPDLATDMDNLRRKVDAGVDFLISQLFFDNTDFFRFRDRCAKAGIKLPIIAGIMPIQSVSQIKRFTQICGTNLPSSLLRRIESVEDDVDSVRHIGMFHATQQCIELLREGVSGIHFYTLNRSTATRAIFQYLRKV